MTGTCRFVSLHYVTDSTTLAFSGMWDFPHLRRIGNGLEPWKTLEILDFAQHGAETVKVGDDQVAA
jgi:hypothetical protein